MRCDGMFSLDLEEWVLSFAAEAMVFVISF
jgi:hypothetical protein